MFYKIEERDEEKDVCFTKSEERYEEKELRTHRPRTDSTFDRHHTSVTCPCTCDPSPHVERMMSDWKMIQQSIAV